MLSAWPGGLVRGQDARFMISPRRPEVRELTCEEGCERALSHGHAAHTVQWTSTLGGGATHGLESSGRSQGLEKGPAVLVSD
jgi:hypothetical protein